MQPTMMKVPETTANWRVTRQAQLLHGLMAATAMVLMIGAPADAAAAAGVDVAGAESVVIAPVKAASSPKHPAASSKSTSVRKRLPTSIAP